MATCATCGNDVRDGARFCGVCGRPVAAPPTGKAVISSLPPTGERVVLPPPPAQPGPTGPPSGPSSGPPTRAILVIAVSVLVVAAVALAVLLSSRSGDDGGETAADGPGNAADEDGTGSEAPTDGESGEADDPEAPETTAAPPPTTEAAGPVEVLFPVSVIPTNTREAVPELRCGGSIDYEADNLFDGDPNTGWGASAQDGTGQSVTVDFGGPVDLVKVGITPGYTRVGPRFDQGCAAVNAFNFNHIIQEVRWTFDDGTSVTQTFAEVPRLQRMDVDVTTSSLTMTILRTRYTGWDTDTVISSMEIRGIR